MALTLFIICVCVFLIDLYTVNGLQGAFKQKSFFQSLLFKRLYWAASFLLMFGLLISAFFKIPVGLRAAVMMLFFLVFLIKLCFLPFILADDVRRLIISIIRKKKEPVAAPTAPEKKAEGIPRSEFLLKAGLLAGALPLTGICITAPSAAYDYIVNRHKLYLPNLPKAFDGLKLGQISDIHSGSFYNKKAVLGGLELFMAEKPDVIFFTGDLVNDRAEEMNGYQDIFSKVKAPLGVFSSLGNHDYGDYTTDWANAAAKEQNAKNIRDCHKNMGWDLLRNENRRLKVGNEEIGILGVENWGSLSRFPKRGRMDLAVKNTDDLPVKLLLSHDPSHWQAVVVPQFKQIDAVFAGHTHGMQFGVKTRDMQWSPIEYVYKEWAGFYREGQQQLYVNVGYGFLGFPGRIGILPEITIFELKAGHDPKLKA